MRGRRTRAGGLARAAFGNVSRLRVGERLLAASGLCAAVAVGVAGCGSIAASPTTGATGVSHHESPTLAGDEPGSAQAQAGEPCKGGCEAESALGKLSTKLRAREEAIRNYGQAASPSELTGVSAELRGYYAAVGRHRFGDACAVLSAPVVREVTEMEARAKQSTVTGCAPALKMLFAGAARPDPTVRSVRGLRLGAERGYVIFSSEAHPSEEQVQELRVEHGRPLLATLVGAPIALAASG